MPLAGCASLVTRFLVQASSRLHAASLRNPSQSVRKPTTWFQLGVAPIEGYLIGKTRVRVTDILTDCLEVSKARQSQKDMNEVVRCLQHLG